VTSRANSSLGSFLQEALWRWPSDAALAERLAGEILILAGATRGGASSEAAAAWAAQLEGLVGLTPTERSMLLARGLRLLAAGELALTEGGGSRGKPAREGRAACPAPELLGLKGCGPRTAERLAARGICSPRDLLGWLPIAYEDHRKLVPLASVEPGRSLLTRGRVTQAGFRGWKGRRFFEARLSEGEATLICRWFRAWPGLAKAAPLDAELLVAGTVREHKGQLQMAHPTIREIPPGEEPGGEGVLPRYGTVEGVASALIRRLCSQAAAQAEELTPEPLPKAIMDALGLPGRAEAFRRLHLPGADLGDEEVTALGERRSGAHRRILFDELFLSQLALAQRRREVKRLGALPCPLAPLPAGIFPFEPTGAQRRVIAEIAEDLGRPEPMQRLVQGDVGSGKTAVAFAAAAQVMAAGGQVALMAPTEILAAQHHATLAPWMERLGRRLALLTASTPRGARESTLALLGAGSLPMVVGTHALLSDRVVFDALSLVIVDEQHRFGVAQRALLRGKGEEGGGKSPHLLVMTATPIPRSLALTLYGDLDLSALDELPCGRVSPKTFVFPSAQRPRVYERILGHLQAGRRAFVVCPLVAESEVLEVADAERTALDLASRLAPHGVGLLHGRLPISDKIAVLRDFREGRLAVLVATTVVEVGVDVPEAEIMVVESAERFGLSQLHQLRGRVGRRAGAEAICLLLVEESASQEARLRLKVMEETADGFRIAEEDLKLRGPGELLGLRQAGASDLGLTAAAAEPRLLGEARRLAREILAEDPSLGLPRHAVLRDLLGARSAGPIFGEESG
jgi:ATP-dependent DNA helicase RecG